MPMNSPSSRRRERAEPVHWGADDVEAALQLVCKLSAEDGSHGG